MADRHLKHEEAGRAAALLHWQVGLLPLDDEDPLR
jgi:hypothetical protein